MNRRIFVSVAALFGFKVALGSHNETTIIDYKGKKLIVTAPDSLEAMCKKREACLPRFKTDKSIVDEMRRFVDMSEGHMDQLGQEIYGCIHDDGSHSVASFSNLPCRTYLVKAS